MQKNIFDFAWFGIFGAIAGFIGGAILFISWALAFILGLLLMESLRIANHDEPRVVIWGCCFGIFLGGIPAITLYIVHGKWGWWWLFVNPLLFLLGVIAHQIWKKYFPQKERGLE